MIRSKWIGVAAVAAISASAGGIGLVQATTGGGNLMTAIAPCRLMDTRAGGPIGPRSTPLGAKETITITATGNNGSCSGIPADTQAIEVQFTSTETTTPSFLTAYPANLTTMPNVSQLNTRPDQAVSNSTIVTLSATGQFKLYNDSGSTNVIIDILGLFSPGSGTVGPAGPAGPAGADWARWPAGPDGPATPATYSNPQWGTILRNTIGSGNASLRGGPYGVGIAPPLGEGSLQILVGDSGSKVAFGNEVDFVGKFVADLATVGFQVFTTGENNGRGNPNMPSITFEIDPNVTGNASNYSSLVWVPAANSPPNTWSGYIDATTTGLWGLTGFPNDQCGLNGPRCTFDAMKALLPDAVIGTAAVVKGRDSAFQGAVDDLRINNKVYDFEPFGVLVTTQAPT